MVSPTLARFGVFELDLRTGELRKRGGKVPLQDQPFQVLALLIARAGDLVTRDELRATLWKNAVFVDLNHGLNKAVGKIRHALGDLADSPRFIETLERRGYRFIAPVECVDTDAAPVGSHARPRLVHIVWNDRATGLVVGTHVIGRDPAAAICIVSSVVSRHHARLVVDEQGVTLEDLGSHNGTFVNGERLDTARALAHGDEIRIGPATLILHDSPDATPTDTDPVR